MSKSSAHPSCVTAQSPRSDRSSASTSASDDSYSSLEGVELNSSSLQNTLIAHTAGYRTQMVRHLGAQLVQSVSAGPPNVNCTGSSAFRHPQRSNSGNKLVNILARTRSTKRHPLDFSPSPQRHPPEGVCLNQPEQAKPAANIASTSASVPEASLSEFRTMMSKSSLEHG